MNEPSIFLSQQHFVGHLGSVQSKLDREVVLDCGHYARDELEEEKEAILDAALAPVALDLVNHALHDRRVVARMDT